MIGQVPPGEELEEELEDLRFNILVEAQNLENNIKFTEVTMRFFGGLEQGETGKIMAGPLTDTRRGNYVEFLKTFMPYLNWEGMEGGAGSSDGGGLDESQVDKDRLDFVNSYKQWAETGGPAVPQQL